MTKCGVRFANEIKMLSRGPDIYYDTNYGNILIDWKSLESNP